MDFLLKLASLAQSELAGLKLLLSLLSSNVKTLKIITIYFVLTSFLSFFLAYPISLIYQLFLVNASISLKCLYFILTSLSISYFNYGNNTIHLLITITVVYCALKINSKSVLVNGFNFIFTLSYLLVGYFLTQTNNYGIKLSKTI